MALDALAIANRALSRLGARRLAAIDNTTAAGRALGDPTLDTSGFSLCRQEVLQMHPWKCATRHGVASWVQKAIVAPGISQASPAVVTATAHGLLAGTIVRLADVGGMTQVNGARYRIRAPVNADDFALELLDGTALDSTGFSAWTSGGTVTVVPLFDFENQYALPSDCLRVLSLEDELPGEKWEKQGRYLLADRGAPIFFRYVTDLTDYDAYDPLLASVLAARLAVELAEEVTQSSEKRDLAMEELGALMLQATSANAREQTPADFEESSWLAARLGV